MDGKSRGADWRMAITPPASSERSDLVLCREPSVHGRARFVVAPAAKVVWWKRLFQKHA